MSLPAARHPDPNPGHQGRSLGAAAPITPLLSAATAVDGRLAVVLRTHRECAPEHAGLVRAACRDDTSVLPRWHQDDRGRRNAHRGVHVQAPDGAYAAIAVWTSRRHWLAFTLPLAIAHHPEVLKKHGVSEAFLRDLALVKSGYADPRTGRRCIVRPKTLASVLDCETRHVQKGNAALRELGLEVVVLRGRMLTADERFGCWRRGSRQRGLATEVALTTPRILIPVDTDTPARGRARPLQTHAHLYSPHGLAAEQEGAASPRQRRKRRHRPAAARRLAAEVALRLPWLASERPGRLAPALTRFAEARQPWTAENIDHAIATHTIRTGRGPIRADQIRTRPAALLAAILRGLDPEADHPGLVDQPTPSGPANVDSTGGPTCEPCGSPDCDGYGWLIHDTNGRAATCPTCPPAVRASQANRPGQLPEFEPHDPPF